MNTSLILVFFWKILYGIFFMDIEDDVLNTVKVLNFETYIFLRLKCIH